MAADADVFQNGAAASRAVYGARARYNPCGSRQPVHHENNNRRLYRQKKPGGQHIFSRRAVPVLQRRGRGPAVYPGQRLKLYGPDDNPQNTYAGVHAYTAYVSEIFRHALDGQPAYARHERHRGDK